MNTVIEISASAAECCIVVSLCNRFLGFRNKKMTVVKSLAFFLILLTENILFTQREWKSGSGVWIESLEIVFLIVLIAGYVLLFLGGRIYEKVLITIFPIIGILTINLIVFSVIRALSGEYAADIVKPGGKARVLAIIFSKLAFFLLCEFVIRMRGRRQYSLSIFQWSIQLSCFLITFLIGYLQLKISMRTDNMPEFLPVSILIAVLNILLYVLLNRMRKDSILKEEYRISGISLAAQEKLIDEAREQYMEIRTLRHDMRHYLTTAAELISEGRTEETKAYIENIVHEKVDRSAYGVDTGDVVIDAVINNRIGICLREHIEIKCMIDSDMKAIDHTDMSVLLSNVLDNAIEGCKRVEKPEIALTIGNRKAFTYIIVKNSIVESVLSRNPDLETDKDDKPAHGFGIMSIRKVAKKYNGSVEFHEEGNLFITEIWLEQPETGRGNTD